MPRRPRLRLTPLEPLIGKQTFGQRLARIRRSKGISQAELADKVGLIQVLVSDYERDKLRLRADLVVRLAVTLGVTTDELLGVKPLKTPTRAPRRALLRRMELIDQLPPSHQRALLKTVDGFIRGVRQG